MSLELSAITHRYAPNSPAVLRDLTFTFPADQSVAVVGPSGSGKTTLLSIIGLLTTPSAGHVLIDGTEATAGDRGAALARATLFAWVFQTVNVLSSRTTLDNAMLGLLARGTSEHQARESARGALHAVGLAGFQERRANSLSGGELQRLCIARAIATAPRFLLADEPTGQLDRTTSDQVTRALIAGRTSGTTLILVTHDPAVAAQCDQVVALQDGQLVRVRSE